MTFICEKIQTKKQYNTHILTKYKLIELRKIASSFTVKKYYKMDKKKL